MKTLNLEYTNKIQLENFIIANKEFLCDNILIQVFTSNNTIEYSKTLLSSLLSFIPNAKIIGASTSGEISQEGALKNATLISFSFFENTIIETSLIENIPDSFELGNKLIRSFPKNPKLIISFSDGLTTNGEVFLDGISQYDNDVIIAGGLAGDNSMFEQTIVFNEKKVINNGAVGACFYNEDLIIATDYNFNWQTLGKKHTITKSVENRVYTIGSRTAVDFYTHYLGKNIGSLLPAIGTEFPLVIEGNGVKIGRSVLIKHDDGSLSFAGNIPEGTLVQFGVCDVDMILEKSINSLNKINIDDIESIFVYSCMARVGVLKDEINAEILPLAKISPISGFFTYGEFFKSCSSENNKSQLLNQTMTILTMSEKKYPKKNIQIDFNRSYEKSSKNLDKYRTQALSSLMKITTEELNELNIHLDKTVSYEVNKNLKKDALLESLKTQAQMGEMLELIIHQWRQPLNAISIVSSGMQLKSEMTNLGHEESKSSFEEIFNYTNELNDIIENFREYYKSSLNLSSIKISEIIHKSLNISTVLTKQHNISLEINHEEDILINVPTGLVMQVVVNIIKNAIDALISNDTKDPKIIISTKNFENSFSLTISDNAGGIDNEILNRIFEKSFTTKDKEGTGIGLDMSKTIIENKLSGKISAKNIDNGASFIIELPK